MSFAKSKFESVTIESRGIVLFPDQESRCSYNYDMTQLASASRMKWSIEPIEGIDIKDVKFDVFQDQSGKDKKLASNVTDGTVTAFLSSSTLYIANVAGIGKDIFFRITITPTYDYK